MIVQTRIAGSSGAPDAREIPVDATVTTLRGLLAVLVRHELEQYEAHRGASHTLEVLTPADLAHGVDTGRYGRESRAVPRPPAEADAVSRALEAFEDGLFLVFVDDVSVTDLDLPLAVHAHSTMRLLRLVALTGA